MEAEIKLLLPATAALRALAARLGVADSRGVHQRNEFFDTPGGALHSAQCHARLRREDDRDAVRVTWVVTLKGPKELSACASLAVRPEEEAVVDEGFAAAILRGDASPLDALPRSPLVEMALAAASGVRPVVQPDQGFSNLRVHAPFELTPPCGAAPMKVTLELDTTTFSAGGVDEEQWEVECELQDLVLPSGLTLETRACEAEAALQALLVSIPEIGAPCPPAKGKRSRQKAFLKARGKEAKAQAKAAKRR